MPIIDPRDFARPALPEIITAAFEGRIYLEFPELVALLETNKVSLRVFINGIDKLPWRQKGLGRKKPHRVFTLSDVEVIWQAMQRGNSCQTLPENTSPDRQPPRTGHIVLLPTAKPSRAPAAPPTSAQQKRSLLRRLKRQERLRKPSAG